MPAKTAAALKEAGAAQLEAGQHASAAASFSEALNLDPKDEIFRL